tara:strand:- start:448 stop:732 length:285 start_codon:yes stop_codon:yes gene_type:complete
MGKRFLSIIVIFVLVLIFLGCNADTNYQAYKDLKKQGEKVFIQNLRSCQEFSAQNVKRSEGSKAAGELLREKNFIFYSCMKKKYWILKKQKTKF